MIPLSQTEFASLSLCEEEFARICDTHIKGAEPKQKFLPVGSRHGCGLAVARAVDNMLTQYGHHFAALVSKITYQDAGQVTRVNRRLLLWCQGPGYNHERRTAAPRHARLTLVKLLSQKSSPCPTVRERCRRVSSSKMLIANIALYTNARMPTSRRR